MLLYRYMMICPEEMKNDVCAVTAHIRNNRKECGTLGTKRFLREIIKATKKIWRDNETPRERWFKKTDGAVIHTWRTMIYERSITNLPSLDFLIKKKVQKTTSHLIIAINILSRATLLKSQRLHRTRLLFGRAYT